MTVHDHDATAESPGGADLRPDVPQLEPTAPTHADARAEPAAGGGSQPQAPDDRLLVVGIGASAGGLAPLEAFFRALPASMPSDIRIAFVVVQHLSPTRESILSQLLARDTGMHVRQVTGDMRTEAGTVYVIPPGSDLIIRDGTLQLVAREDPAEYSLPIDTFFRSLADDRGEWAAGIVLSGAGADGTLGVRAIKEAGGLVIVQDPDTAEQASMPRSAISTGLVDYVLSPDRMPQALFNYAGNFLQSTLLRAEQAQAEATRALGGILAILRTRTGHDFSLYKRNTILRRVQRRMTIRQIRTLDEYATLLLQDPQEVTALFKEMLIGVTEFFRDPEAFELLAEQVIPELIEGASPAQPLRVWVAACATGEEAYSIAILIREKMDDLASQVPVQIFATDIDDRSIEVARQGRYPASIAADVGPERLSRFFQEADGGYVVAEAVRQMIVFAPQSVVKDPPFSHVDLITCRNLLIYLEPELQRSVVSVFEYSLEPGGYLLLGSSETLSDSSHYFELANRKWKLYRRLKGRSRLATLPDALMSPVVRTPAEAVMPPSRQAHVRQQLERLLLEHYQPATLVVDAEGRILFTYGDVGRYLQPTPGETGGWHVMQMLRARLRVPVAAGIRHAASEREIVRQTGLHLDDTCAVDVVIRPVERPAVLEGMVFVEFTQPALPAVPILPAEELEHEPAGSQQVHELERELQSTKEYLQAVIEELQSSNEEIRSTNEELQSANEELETSQEEAQSVNEELATLNSELESRVDELTWANNDMTNVLSSIDVGIIFLDRRFHVRRFNKAATRIVNLIPADLGRPATHLSSNLVKQDWVEDARRVFETLTPLEEVVRTQDGHWHLMRVRPYRTVDDAIEGAVLTFSDITKQTHAERAARAAQIMAESIVQTVREPLLILDEDLRVQVANRAFYETFGVDRAETENRLVYDLGNRQWDIPQLRALLEEIIPENESFDGYEVDHDFERIGRHRMILNARRVSVDDQPARILLAIESAK